MGGQTGGSHDMGIAASRTSTRRVAITVLGMLLAGACSSAHAHVAPPASSTGPTVAGGCHPTLTAGRHSLTLQVGSRRRLVIAHVPPGLDLQQPRALVVDLHGSNSTAATQEIFSGMDTAADADGFVVVYPQANIPSGAGFVWNIPGVPLVGGRQVPAGSADDIAFIEGVVAKLRAVACIDPARVYATGFSGGARLSSQLACDASTTFAAIAPVSGLRLPSPCPATRAVPVITFHGRADPVDPYAGNGQAYWTYSVPVAAQRWAAHDGCAATPTTTEPAPGATLTAYGGCRDGARVELYSLTGEGHEWPGGPAMPRATTSVLGPQSNAVSAADLMWAFFAAHPMP